MARKPVSLFAVPDEFDDPALARQLYATAFPLVDITVVPDNERLCSTTYRDVELVQKLLQCQRLSDGIGRALSGYF